MGRVLAHEDSTGMDLRLIHATSNVVIVSDLDKRCTSTRHFLDDAVRLIKVQNITLVRQQLEKINNFLYVTLVQ